MNLNSRAIFTTAASGYTYVATDEQYVGCVRTYNNKITKAIAGFFNDSIEVQFGRKVRCVSTRGYEALLRRLGVPDVTSETVHLYTDFSAVNMRLPANKQLMIQYLEYDAIVRLSEKLIRRLTSGPLSEETKTYAKRLFAKGACVAFVLAYFTENPATLFNLMQDRDMFALFTKYGVYVPPKEGCVAYS